MDYKAEFDYFLRGKESLRMDVSVPEMSRLTKEQVRECNVVIKVSIRICSLTQCLA